MKKLFLGFLVLSVALLSACTAQTNTGFKFSTNEDILSFQALIASSLLPNSENETLNAKYNATGPMLVSTETASEFEKPSKAEVALTNIEPYVELIEKILGTNNGLSVIVEDSSLEEYTYMMTFDTSGLLGETQYYVMHYNMTLKDDDDDEDELEYLLDGIMIVNDQEYILTGKREIEDDEDKIEFIAKLDDQNYIETEYKVEDEETKFQIKVIADGVLVSETEIKIEEEDKETKVELEFLSGLNKGKYEFKYEVEDGQNVLKVEFDTEIDGIETTGKITLLVLVDEVTGETYYQAYVDLDDDDDRYEKDFDRDIDDDDDNDDTEDNEETKDNDESDES